MNSGDNKRRRMNGFTHGLLDYFVVIWYIVAVYWLKERPSNWMSLKICQEAFHVAMLDTLPRRSHHAAPTQDVNECPQHEDEVGTLTQQPSKVSNHFLLRNKVQSSIDTDRIRETLT